MIQKGDLTLPIPVITLLLCDATDARAAMKPREGMETRMKTYRISSPNAAELYFTNSIIGGACAMLAEALGGPRPRSVHVTVRSSASTRERAGRTAPPPRRWLDRIDAWVWNQRQKDLDRYLAGSADVFELERRIATIERGSIGPYY